MVCGNITGNISDPTNVTLYTTESTVRTPTDTTESMGMNNSATSQVYIISFSCLATALFVGAVASLTVILKRSRAKIRAVSVQSNRAEETTHNELVYENVTHSPSPSASAINTQDNVAYGNTRTSTTGATHDIPTYQNEICPFSQVGIVNTQDNVAYGRAKTSTRGAKATQDEPMYEEVTGPLPLVSTIAT